EALAQFERQRVDLQSAFTEFGAKHIKIFFELFEYVFTINEDFKNDAILFDLHVDAHESEMIGIHANLCRGVALLSDLHVSLLYKLVQTVAHALFKFLCGGRTLQRLQSVEA